AAAGITGNAAHGYWIIGWYQPGGNKRTQKRNGPLRPAARIGDEARLGDFVGLGPVHLGKAVSPSFAVTVGGGGVDDTRAAVLDQRDALSRRVVWQAENGYVGGVEELGARGRILASLQRDRDEFDIRAAFEPRADLETGSAVFAVDEDLCHSTKLPNDR